MVVDDARGLAIFEWIVKGRRMDFDRARSLLPDYALGLLDEDEAAEVAAWVARSPELRTELAVYAEAGEALLLGTEPAELAPETLDRLVAGVRTRVETERMDTPIPKATGHAHRTPAPRAGRGKALALALVAAVFVAGMGFAWAWTTWGSGGTGSDDPQRGIAEAALQLSLHGESTTGHIYVADDFESGVVYFADLPPAPSDHHYELWSDGPAGPQKAAAFQGNGEEQYVSLPALPREMTRMFVTVEADGDPPVRPTGPEVLSTRE